MKTLLFFCFLFCFLEVSAQKNTNQKALLATQSFLKSLDTEKRNKAFFPYDTEERRSWFFVPIERKGLPLMEMNDEQKSAAINLINATLSESASKTTLAIMQLEIVLKQIEKLAPENNRRHPGKFYFSVFGNPDAQKLWGWRIEGHHVSLNFSAENGKVISGTPLFFGSNPAIVPEGYPEAGKQLIKQEEILGVDLLQSFSEEQLKKAIVSDKAPVEILSSNTAHFLKSDSLKMGISFAEMNKVQQQKLIKLISFYVDRYPFGFANEFMEKIEKAGLDKLMFAWMGAKQAKLGNGGHYYRIQNPVLFLEYDNTQNNANHVHTVIRDLTNDFGEDMLRKHYAEEHKK